MRIDAGLKKNGGIIPNTPSAAADTLSMQENSPGERRYFRLSLGVIGITFLVMLFFFAAAFFLAVRGAEGTVVPQVVDAELTEALVKLQERELYARLQMRYTGNPLDKGRVIAQNPESGLYVKAGRRVTITVSSGAVVDNVENYVGKTLDEVRGRLAALFSTYEPLLAVREPVSYVYDEAPAGTVISQTPAAETPLSGPVDLVLIVSRGPADPPVKLPDWRDWDADAAMRSVAGIPLLFSFTEDEGEAQGSAPRITGQSPAPGTNVERGRRVIFTYRAPASYPEGSRYGLFEYTLRDFPVPVEVEVILREPGLEDRTLFSTFHSGGLISFPYVLPEGTGIVLMADGSQEYRFDILAEP